MFSTITGIRFKSKNVEDLLEEVHRKLGVAKESIYIHNEYVGFFNTEDKEVNIKEINSKEVNIKEINSKEINSKEINEEVEVLDYKKGLIVKKIPPPGSNIYKHLLCDEEELQIETKNEILTEEEISKLVASLDKPNEVEKQKICENIEAVIKELFKDKL